MLNKITTLFQVIIDSIKTNMKASMHTKKSETKKKR